MTPSKRSLAWLLCLSVFSSGAAASASEIGRLIAHQVEEASYRHYLDDMLYTHDGDDRGHNGPEHDLARDNIVSTLEGFGLQVELHPFQYASETFYNVVATQLGTVYPDSYYVVGAHYDSVGNPGADDDGSGVAGLLEIARILSWYETEYTIKYIAFDIEEWGMVGSEAYVEDHLADDILGMVQLDMIAWDEGDYACDLFGRNYENQWKQALAVALSEYGNDLSVQVNSSLDASDHASFENAGFPACALTENYYHVNPCYHGYCDSVDTPDYISYDFATDMVRGVAGFLGEQALAGIPGGCDTGEGCELGTLGDEDCNGNSLWDACDIICEVSDDVNANGIPDECEPRRTIYVDQANCPGPGSGSEADPFCRIQDGIDAAGDGLTELIEVVVADGVYIGEGNKELSFDGKRITVRSQNGAENCILNCEGSGWGFRIRSGETPATVVDGLTITNGYCGILCDNSSSPTIANCTITNNIGGGISCRSYCSPMITDCIIANNTANDGGGISCEHFANPTIIGCTITNNTANDDGGGIFCEDFASPTIIDCTITNNSADDKGGGIYCVVDSNPTIMDCAIMNNTSSGGGALACYGSAPTITNCMIANNTSNWGGGLACSSRNGNPRVTNCTIANNTAYNNGAGVYCTSESSPTIINSILAGNSPHEIFVHSGSPTFTYTSINGGWEGEGNINADPLFVLNPDDGGDGWGDNPDTPDVDEGANDIFGDLHLTPFSPCIDAGDPASDFGLEPEPDGGRVNMGAYGNTPEATSKAGLGITGYGLVSRTRVGRTVFAYELAVSVHNSSDAAADDVVLTLLDMPDNVTIGDEPGEDTVDVGPIAAGATVTSVDTFKIIVDRTVPVSSLAISWSVAYTLDGKSGEYIFSAPLSGDDLDGEPVPGDGGEPEPGDDDELDVDDRDDDLSRPSLGAGAKISACTGNNPPNERATRSTGESTTDLSP